MILTDEEVDAICAPLKQAAAQVRYLRKQGLHVTTKPNGRAVVVRAHLESVLSGGKLDAKPQAPAHSRAAAPDPDRTKFIMHHGGKSKHGPQTKVKPA